MMFRFLCFAFLITFIRRSKIVKLQKSVRRIRCSVTSTVEIRELYFTLSHICWLPYWHLLYRIRTICMRNCIYICNLRKETSVFYTPFWNTFSDIYIKLVTMFFYATLLCRLIFLGTDLTIDISLFFMPV